MEINLNAINISVLVSVMLVGGLLPSMSSLMVLSRTASSGVLHGVSTSIGIVLGDIFYIIFAIFGLAILSTNLGAIYDLLVFIGGTYLIWLGTQFWQNKSNTAESTTYKGTSLLSSLFAGLMITLSDQKAILFYLGFFPALFDLSKITLLDIFIIIIITIVVLGSAKLSYVFMGHQITRRMKNTNIITIMNKISAAILIVLGAYIMLTT